jgi:predicted O-methyltransferase YrrM
MPQFWMHSLRSFAQYYFRSVGIYHVQSPMVYALASLLLEGGKQEQLPIEPEIWRQKCLHNPQKIRLLDLGFGSREGKAQQEKSIAQIARTSLSPMDRCLWLYRLAQWWQPSHLLELGTSLGVSTLYLSKACPYSHLVTVEGSPAQAALAKQAFDQYASAPIDARVGAFKTVLPQLTDIPWEMVFLDGHHDGQATLDYWKWVLLHSGERCLMVFDDIYWSPSMTAAWREIQSKSLLTIDLFYFGLVILDPKIMKSQHFSLVPYRWKPWQIGLFV